MRTDCSSATGIQIALPRLQFLCLQSGTEQREVPVSVKRIALEVTLDTWMGPELTNPGGVEPRSGRFQSRLPCISETHYNFGWETQWGFCPASRAFPGWPGRPGAESRGQVLIRVSGGEKGKTPPHFGSRVKPRAWGSCRMPKVSSWVWRLLFLAWQVLCARTVVAGQPKFSGQGLGLWDQADLDSTPSLQASVSSSVKWG